MESLMRKPIYWESTYEKLLNKTVISDLEKAKLGYIYNNLRDQIVDEIISGKYEWSTPRKVELRKVGTTKKRIVYIYDIKDRLVLGMLYHVFSEYFKDRISETCYSYKTGVNTGKAIKFIREYQPNERQYGVKLDIHAYFNNISESRVHEMLDELFSDKYNNIKIVLEKLFFNNTCNYHKEEIQEYKGIVPGTPLASFFANYCLRECDLYFENKESIYARYSDDIIILDESKEQLDKDIETAIKFIKQYGLEINDDKYTYFNPGDDITFLGLKLCKNGKIDMSDHAKAKIKKQIHRWCRKGRKEIEMEHKDFYKIAKNINNRINNKNFKCYINHEGSFGWCHYMFRYITTEESLREIDLYTKDTLRAMKTGKHNKANYKALTEEEFKEMNWVSLVQLFHLYKKDFEYYCEIISLL